MAFEFITNISASIDYVGQKNAERLFQIIITLFAIIGFAWGFYVQKFSETLIVLGVGILLSALLVLPPWPFWKKNQLKWVKPVKKETKDN